MAHSPASDAPNNGASMQGATATSGKYSDTVRSIKKWLESEETEDLSRLLRIGETRSPDFVAACHSSEEELAGAALLTLQLLGKSECETCADAVSQMRGDLAVVCSSNMSEAAFERIDLWLAKKRTGTGYECGEDYDPFTPMADSVVYALILDGSPRSRSILDSMLVFQKACATGPTIIGEVLEQAPALIVAAKQVGHNLTIEPGKLESSVHVSAFFLPQKYRKDSKVEVIARNKARDRVLLEVSYQCGALCGKGYYVLLRQDGADWHYAFITMAWIS